MFFIKQEAEELEYIGQFKGAFCGVYCTLFILAKDSKSLKDLKKNKKNWGILCKVVLQGGPFEIGPF